MCSNRFCEAPAGPAPADGGKAVALAARLMVMGAPYSSSSSDMASFSISWALGMMMNWPPMVTA